MEAARAPVTATIDGKPRKITKLQATAMQLATNAAGGDRAAMAKFLDWMDDIEARAAAARPAAFPLSESDSEVHLRLLTRRFSCEVSHCRRRIFAERFGDDVVPVRRRRTARLEHIVHHLGLALGGRPAAVFAKRLMLPVSNDT